MLNNPYIINSIIFSLAFLIGAIPFSLIVGKVFFNKDIRTEGSGNPGATNTLRVLGKKAGISVLILDVFKGILAVLLSKLTQQMGHINTEVNTFIAGGLAVLGHIFSPFLKFKGGKGVATATGVIFILQPYTGLALLGVFLLTVIITKYVSLGSILSASMLPIMNFFIYGRADYATLLFTGILGLIIVYKHKSNILKLIKGDENKLSLGQVK
jgi:glycerol-3-phosphate acyltransferase PlsY